MATRGDGFSSKAKSAASLRFNPWHAGAYPTCGPGATRQIHAPLQAGLRALFSVKYALAHLPKCEPPTEKFAIEPVSEVGTGKGAGLGVPWRQLWNMGYEDAASRDGPRADVDVAADP